MEQKDLLETYQSQKAELKKQEQAKLDAAVAAKAAKAYIAKVKTEVDNTKKQLKEQYVELGVKCKSECEVLDKQLAELPAESKKERAALKKQILTVKKDYKDQKAKVTQLLELAK